MCCLVKSFEAFIVSSGKASLFSLLTSTKFSHYLCVQQDKNKQTNNKVLVIFAVVYF